MKNNHSPIAVSRFSDSAPNYGAMLERVQNVKKNDDSKFFDRMVEQVDSSKKEIDAKAYLNIKI